MPPRSRALTAALDDWRAAAQVPAGPVRTCFRLTEPGATAQEAQAAGAGRTVAGRVPASVHRRSEPGGPGRRDLGGPQAAGWPGPLAGL